MTPEQINKAIAEHLGWFLHEDKFGGPTYWAIKKDGFINIYPSGNPNYYGDLNAMHEAEETLTEVDQWILYQCHLAEGQTKFIVHATAAQRAEAFLRTIGKWQD